MGRGPAEEVAPLLVRSKKILPGVKLGLTGSRVPLAVRESTRVELEGGLTASRPLVASCRDLSFPVVFVG
jgi:hypothetical protein